MPLATGPARSADGSLDLLRVAYRSIASAATRSETTAARRLESKNGTPPVILDGVRKPNGATPDEAVKSIPRYNVALSFYVAGIVLVIVTFAPWTGEFGVLSV